MITVRDLEITIGPRVLMSGVNFQVSKGDKVGLVGRNGAGKTTLTRVIAGDFQASNGTVEAQGEIGYLPLFSNAQTMILDEPTNHLDADSVVWLREFLKNYSGGLIVISHDLDIVEETVNRVFYLDANRALIDIYNMGWKAYLKQREPQQNARLRYCKSKQQNSELKPVKLPLLIKWLEEQRNFSVALKRCAKRTE